MAEKSISLRDKQIDVADLPQIAEQVCAEYEGRQTRRSDLEKQWDEVDRQVAMIPETSHKKSANGQTDPNKAWMPETELPLQAQTLEMLTADARRLIFPRGGEWFQARAALTDDYMQRFANAETPIPKETGRFEGALNQDNADRLAQSTLSHYHRQYDLAAHVDIINAEAFSYGFGVGRVVPVKKRILGHAMKGSDTQMVVPMLLPRSARNVYLDDSSHAVMHEGYEIGPNTILHRRVKLADLRAAAQNDSSYLKSQLDRLTTDKSGEVEIVELEGDLVYETSQSTVVVRDVVITAARGTGKQASFGAIRHRKSDGNTYLVFDYHRENTKQRNGSAPLLKGAPINRLAAQVMNELVSSGQLKVQPPLGYSRDEPSFAATGGPVVYPGAQWETTDPINVYDEVGGDPSVFFNIFSGLLQLYSDVTGINAPRLGAQTKSHTTAFAKDVELSQGAVRTVDYVNSALDGPLQHFLEMEYRMALKSWKKQVVYVGAWNEFVELERAHLPDIVAFQAMGTNAPAEDAQRAQAEMQAIQLALQIDSVAIQMGRESKMDHGAIIDKILRRAGIQDVSEVTIDSAEAAPQGNGQLPGILSGELQ